MNMIDPVLAEFAHEAAVTRRVLERAPEQHFGWKPHEKSMTLGRLAGHVAEIPGWVKLIIEQDEVDFDPGSYKPPQVDTSADLLTLYDANVKALSDTMKGMTNEQLLRVWRLKMGGQVRIEMPRMGVIRAFLLSHTYHHRGQLAVYLRLLDVPVPSVYGPSADEEG